MSGLEVQHLSVEFRTAGGVLQAVRDISFSLKPGHTLALIGESGSGKTTFTLNIAANVALSGTPVLFFSFEMNKIDIFVKITNYASAKFCAKPLSYSDLRTERKWTATEKRALNDVSEFTKQNIQPRITVIDAKKESLSATEIKSCIDHFIGMCDSKPIVIIDYLQLISSEKNEKTIKETLENAIDTLNQVADEHQLAILAISSTSKQTTDSSMSVFAAAESARIAFASVTVMCLVAAEKNPPEKTNVLPQIHLDFHKNRFGDRKKHNFLVGWETQSFLRCQGSCRKKFQSY